MKWFRTLVILTLVLAGIMLAHQTALAVSKPYREWVPEWLGGMADADVTVTFRMNPEWAAPIDFTATYVTDNSVRLDWGNSVNATATIIRAKYNTYPSSELDGYLVYYGAGLQAFDNATDWNTNLGTIYYVAYSENSTGGLQGPAQASLESPGMTAFNSLLGLTILPLIVVIALVSLAFWRRETFLFIFAGVACLGFAGLWGSQANGQVLMLIEAVLAVLLGAYCIIKGAAPPYTW